MPSLVQNNTLSVIKFTVYDQTPNGVPVNLTNSSVNLRYRIGSSGPLRTISSITITDAVNGKCQHQFTTGELNLIGLLVGDAEVVNGAFSGRTFRFSVDVLEPVN